MPFFRLLVHGQDPTLPSGTRGFYATRQVWAPNVQIATDRLFRKLQQEFTTGESAHIWNSQPPHLNVERAYRIGAHQLLAAPNRGSSFYDERKGPYREYSTVRVIKPVTDLGAAAGAVVSAIPVGSEGTIVAINDGPDMPLSYAVEFSGLRDERGFIGRVDTILHEELGVVHE
jgi:hypothetical protein